MGHALRKLEPRRFSFFSPKDRKHYESVLLAYLQEYPTGTTDRAAINILSSCRRSGRIGMFLVHAKMAEWLGLGRSHEMILAALIITALNDPKGNLLSYANGIMERWENPKKAFSRASSSHAGHNPLDSFPTLDELD